MNRTKINQQANKKLKELYQKKGITYCEVCGSDFGLSFAHKNKRIFYYGREHLLSDFNETLLLCIPCHQAIEHDKEATNKLFERLRLFI